MSGLRDILGNLDEERMYLTVGLKHDIARESFELPLFITDDYEVFISTIQAYYFHHMEKTGVKISEGNARAGAMNTVEQAFKSQGGLAYAVEIVQSGAEGGMKRVVDVMCDYLKKADIENHIQSVLFSAISPANYVRKVEVMQEFLKQYGGFLPSSNRPVYATELAAYCYHVIKGLADKIGSIRKLTRLR